MYYKINKIFIILLFILLCFNNYIYPKSINDIGIIKSFPIVGGIFDSSLRHRTEWIYDNKNGIIETISWKDEIVPTEVLLSEVQLFDDDYDDDDYYDDYYYDDYDEDIGLFGTFNYKGQIINTETDVDKRRGTFIYHKRETYIYINRIDTIKKKSELIPIIFIDESNYINIQNIKIYQNSNGNKYFFIYVQSGDDRFKTGIYCYKLDDIITNNNIIYGLEGINFIHIPNLLRQFENFSIIEDINNPNNIILTSIYEKNRLQRYISNYFLDFVNLDYTRKDIIQIDNAAIAPKIIQNEEHKIVYFKKGIPNNRFRLCFIKIDDNYEKIINEYESEDYYIYDFPSNLRIDYINRDIGLQATWTNQDTILFTGVVIAYAGDVLKPASMKLIIAKLNILTGEFDIKTLIEERSLYFCYNSKINYNKNSGNFEVIWIAETDMNRNGHRDRDVFITYGNFDDDTSSYNSINLSNTPRSVWSPQFFRDTSNNKMHYIWIQEHPERGYEFYYVNNNREILYTVFSNLNLPMYGDNVESIFTLLFYLLLSFGIGIFEGTILNIFILLPIFLLIFLIYKKTPNISNNDQTIIILISSLIIIFSYDLFPFSNPINTPTFHIFLGGAIISFIIIIIIDRFIYKSSIPSVAESCIKVWFFSILFSTYIAYSFVSTFIVSEMVVHL